VPFPNQRNQADRARFLYPGISGEAEAQSEFRVLPQPLLVVAAFLISVSIAQSQFRVMPQAIEKGDAYFRKVSIAQSQFRVMPPMPRPLSKAPTVTFQLLNRNLGLCHTSWVKRPATNLAVSIAQSQFRVMPRCRGGADISRRLQFQLLNRNLGLCHPIPENVLADSDYVSIAQSQFRVMPRGCQRQGRKRFCGFNCSIAI
jgi:hypothetical protein